jgi:hypothetical protein
MTTERINGREWLAEPGHGLLFRRGDAMEGETSEEIEGISILLPPHWLPEASMPIPPLLADGAHSQAVLRQARHLGAAIAQQPDGAIHAADQLRETLQVWFDGWLQPQRRERFTSRRRRSTVNEARQWMAERLQRLRGLLLNREHDSCSVAELMTASGLIASGVTSADYRLHFGESPRQTRRQSSDLP